MSLLLDVFPRLPWTVVNPEEAKAASLLLVFPTGIRWANATEAGAGPGMQEVMAGAASSRRGKPLPGQSSRFCLRFDPSPSVVRHRATAGCGFVLAMQELAAEDGDGMQQPTGGSGSVWQQVGLWIQGCHQGPGTVWFCTSGQRENTVCSISLAWISRKNSTAVGGIAGRGGRGAPHESGLGGGGKAAARQIPPAPTPCCIVSIGAAAGLRHFPKSPAFPQRPWY